MRIGPIRKTPKHIILEMTKSNARDRILKAARLKRGTEELTHNPKDPKMYSRSNEIL